MSTNSLFDGWPGSPSAVVFRMDGGMAERIVEFGDLQAVRPWASVSKAAVALAFAIEVEWELHTYEEVMGPRGATLANLLSHSGGLGLEESDPTCDVGTKRVYSNIGFDSAVAAIVGENPAANWLDNRIFTPYGMNSTTLTGRPSSGVEGSTEDLLRLAIGWMRPDAISKEMRNRVIRPYMPDLDGVVPGFGRFSPCPWGLGVEVRGEKNHWMGDWLPTSFGHFGQSGALLLLNVDEKIGVVATSTEPFGPWAQELWPTWTSAVRSLALGL